MTVFSLLVSVMNFMLIMNLWGIVASHERSIHQEANPTINVERPRTLNETADEYVRDRVNTPLGED